MIADIEGSRLDLLADHFLSAERGRVCMHELFVCKEVV
jgi:hypothetical protein